MKRNDPDAPSFEDLGKRLSEVEIVSLEVDVPQKQEQHPILKFAGVFKDDPDFDAVQEEIEAYRRELDAEVETGCQRGQ